MAEKGATKNSLSDPGRSKLGLPPHMQARRMVRDGRSASPIRRVVPSTPLSRVFPTSQAVAQGLTGVLAGTVKDQQGGVLPGASVRIASPALMGGEQRATTNDKGQWRFHVLPPGQYTLIVDRAPAFTIYRVESLTIGAGETRDITVVLQVASVTQSVDVEADAGINSRGSGLETRFGPDYIRTVPTRRFSMFDLIRSSPGVSPTSPASGTVNTVSVFGSAVNENAFLIDGTNFTCPCQGVSRAEPIVDVIQEMHVQSMGASVEYGNIQGGVFNVVTKQGGARLAAESSYYAQPSSLTAQPVEIAGRGYERDTYRDLTASLGGPVKRDRVWFFGAYQYLHDYDTQPGADPTLPRTYEQDKFFGKVTWRPTSSMQVMHSYHHEVSVNPTAPTFATPFVATQRVEGSVPSMTFGNLTHVISDRTMWEARAGRFTLNSDGLPSSGDYSTPPHRDLSTGISSANAGQLTGLMLDRVTAKAVLHRFVSGAGTDHHFKVGTAFERGEHQLNKSIPGGMQFLDFNGGPRQVVLRAPSLTGGVFLTGALFASDSFTINDRVTADAGVRFDHSRAISQDLPALDADGNETGAIEPGLGTMYTWNVISPRLGLTAKLDRSGRTVLRASYGRFNSGVLTGELDPISPGTTPTTTMRVRRGDRRLYTVRVDGRLASLLPRS